MSNLAVTYYFNTAAELMAFVTRNGGGAVAAPAAPAAKPAAAAASAPAAAGPKLEDVQAKGKTLMETKGKDAFVAVLGQFKAKKLSDVKAEQYADFIKAIDAALAVQEDPLA